MKKNLALPMVVILFSIVLLACALGAPPSTSTPTPTTQPSDTTVPASTSAPTATDTAIPTEALTVEPTATPTESNSTGDACVISTDKTYGYTQENAIKVGGGDFGGPPREQAYLDNLAGPNGEHVSYGDPHSLDFDDTILDVFNVSGLGKDVTLYIDEYSFTEPQAPVGFTCVGPFSLTAP